jgi:hypothetical protein
MTAKNGEGGKWCQTTVAIREDILAAAQSAGIDIQDQCNRALAGAAGIRYIPEPREKKPQSAPVIIADPGRPGHQEKPGENLHPVINADDPRARTAVKLLPKQKAGTPPAALPGRVSPPEKPLPTPTTPAPAPHPEKPKKAVAGKSGKRQKASPIRQFVAERIARDEGEECHISKEALYLAFTQWCRERRITPVPDRRSVTVTLKNQFAMAETTIAGEPSWINAQIR